MATATKTRNELQVIRLPRTEALLCAIATKANPVFGLDADRDKLAQQFAGVIGDRLINARGLSVMWERTILECFPYPASQIHSRMEEYFPSVVKAIAPEDMAAQAIEFRNDMLRDEAVISARA